jgi:hypothetical protein
VTTTVLVYKLYKLTVANTGGARMAIVNISSGFYVLNTQVKKKANYPRDVGK